ncbi:MAG: hypothetical protein IIC70_10760, partial [Acidobacteria bacterium]|nr:hypothetical protein [Acidobacteriota bacterium]
LKFRREKVVSSGGAPLAPGDLFQLDYEPFQLDQVFRITKRTDGFDGREVVLDIVNERGLFAQPYAPPKDARPDIGITEPTIIQKARVFELPLLNGGKIEIGLPAKRPPSAHPAPFGALTGEDVVGFQVLYSADDSTYDLFLSQFTWAVRGILRVALTSGATDPTVKITLDSDNFDSDKLTPQSAEEQDDDTLLIIINEEVFTIGGVTNLGGDQYDLPTAKRARLGSLAAAHAINDEVWVLRNDELTRYTHARFVENQTRYFKLKPFTSSRLLDDVIDELHLALAPPGRVACSLWRHDYEIETLRLLTELEDGREPEADHELRVVIRITRPVEKDDERVLPVAVVAVALGEPHQVTHRFPIFGSVESLEVLPCGDLLGLGAGGEHERECGDRTEDATKHRSKVTCR